MKLSNTKNVWRKDGNTARRRVERLERSLGSDHTATKHATARSLRRAETRSPRSRGVPGPSPRTAKRWRAARAASRKMNNVLSEVFRSERRSEKKRDSIYNFIRSWSQFLDRVTWRSALARRLPKPLCDTHCTGSASAEAAMRYAESIRMPQPLCCFFYCVW